MKRVLFLGLGLVMLLCGCVKNGNVFPQLFDISFKLSIEYYNEKYTLSCERDSLGVIRASVISPEELSGYSFTVNGEDIKADFRGVEYTPKDYSYFSYNIISKFCRIMSSIDTTSPIRVKNGENPTLKGSVDSTPYRFTFSPKGLPLSISLPENELKAYFSAVKIKTEA